MNLGNALGKFGALVVDVVTFVKESLTNVSDDFAEWLGTESGKSALRAAVGVALHSLLDAHEAFKKELAKPFTPVGERHFPGSTENWRAGEFFTTANEKTKFWSVDSNLLTFLGDCEIGSSPARKLLIQQLKHAAKDSEILPQLGDNPDLTPAEFRWLLERGNLSRGKWYAGYIARDGVRRAVCFELLDNDWNVSCYPVSDAYDWYEGVRFVSPAKPCESSGA